MDGESPAWLEGGDAKKAAATSAAPSSLMSEDDAPTASAAARTGLDNASASTFLSTATTPKENKFLSKFGGKKKAAATDAATTPTAPAAPLSTSQVLAGEADLPKLILFMRLVNMAAAALLITTSVSDVRFICSFRNIKGRRTFVAVQTPHTHWVWGKQAEPWYHRAFCSLFCYTTFHFYIPRRFTINHPPPPFPPHACHNRFSNW